jgi:serine/threonine protein phosphatase PrpC
MNNKVNRKLLTRQYGSLLINPYTLSFKDKILNDEFVDDVAIKSRRVIRLSMIFAIIIYVLFGLIDQDIVLESPDKYYPFRMIGIAQFTFVILSTYSPLFKRYSQAILSSIVLVGGLNVLMISLDKGNSLYAGLILTSIYAHSLLRLRFIYASLTTWALIIAYFIILIYQNNVPSKVVMNNAFFLVTSNLLGMVASYSIEYFMRSAYWKSHIVNIKSSELEAEYSRKSAELESARQIQLSMLPQALPEHPELEIAVTMQTASEIGGDYYDFHLAEDNTLTFAIGDATGHGAKAGAMVTAIKTLFSNYAPHMELTEFLKKSNHFIKQIKLPNLYMSLGVGKIKDDILEISGVGLPPFLIFRNSSGSIEELPLKGIPLGSFTTFPFIKRTIKLSPDDTLVFLTDGLPELFNKQKEMFGYEKIREILLESNQNSVKEILDEIKIKASDWNNHQQDDITLLIIRKKGKASDNSLINAKNINLSFKDRTLN